MYWVGGEVKAPVVMSKVYPDYSSCRLEGKIMSGIPIAEAVIDAKGRVTHVSLVKGIEPCVDKQFLASLRKWRLKPGTREGEPVAVRMNFTLLIHYR